MSTCKCDIRYLMSTGHDSGCPESKANRSKSRTYSPAKITINGGTVGVVKEIKYLSWAWDLAYPDAPVMVAGPSSPRLPDIDYEPSPAVRPVKWTPLPADPPSYFDAWYDEAYRKMLNSFAIPAAELSAVWAKPSVYVLPNHVSFQIWEFTV